MAVEHRSDEMGWAQMATGEGRPPSEKQPWGGVLAHLRDPGGNILTLLGNSD